MRFRFAGIAFALLVTLLFLQGAVQGGGSIMGDSNVEVLSGTMIYSTSHTVDRIAVYGNTAAWVEWNPDNPDIKGYKDGSIVTFASSADTERWVSVGDIVAWEDYPIDSNGGNIMSSEGLVYSGKSPQYPDVYGYNVVFVDNGKIMAKIDGNLKVIDDLGRDYIEPRISSNYIVYGNYVYKISTGQKWAFYHSNKFIRMGSDVSGDWVIAFGRNNFGKSIYIDAFNLYNGAYLRVWYQDVGQYTYFDSVGIDGNLIYWSCDGIGYVYDLVSMKLTSYSVVEGSLDSLVIGGGKMLWGVVKDDGSYEIYMGDAPITPQNYIEVTLFNSGRIDASIVTLLIKDSNGNMLGYDANYKHYKSIPNAVILIEGGTYSYRLFGSGYTYSVIGSDGGKYSLKIRHFGNARAFELDVEALNITISKNEVHQYIVDWAKLADKVKGAVQVSIDKDGDGTFESNFELSTGTITDTLFGSGGNNGNSNGGNGGSGTTESPEPFEFSFNIGGTLCLAMGALIFLVFIALIVRLARRRR